MQLVSVDWEITKRCNQACSFCLNASGPHFQDALSTKECKLIIDKLVDFGIFHMVVTGGEPFVRPDISEILHYAASKNLIWTLTSNGSAITPQLMDQLSDIRANFRSLQISLHGLSHSTYSQYSIDPSLIQVVQSNVLSLIDRGFTTTIICLFNGSNHEEVIKVYEWCAEGGVYGFITSSIKPTGRAADVKGKYDSAAHQWVGLLKDLFALQRKIDGPRILVSEPALFQEYANKRLKTDLIKYSCPAGTETFMIKHDGSVYPCPFISTDCTNDTSAMRFRGGNIVLDSLEEIFATQAFVEFKDNLTTAEIIDGSVDHNCKGCGKFKNASCLPCQLGNSSCHSLVRATTDLARAV